MTPQLSAQPILSPVERPETWLSFKEVARLESYSDGAKELTERAIQLRVKAGKYLVRASSETSRNGKAVRQIALLHSPLPRRPSSWRRCATWPKASPLRCRR